MRDDSEQRLAAPQFDPRRILGIRRRGTNFGWPPGVRITVTTLGGSVTSSDVFRIIAPP